MKALLQLALIALTLCTSALSFADRQTSDDEQHIDDPRVQHRSYEFPGTGESIPYAVFVPSSYDSSQGAPLIVSLHGLGRSHDWLMGYHGLLDQAVAISWSRHLAISAAAGTAPEKPMTCAMPSVANKMS